MLFTLDIHRQFPTNAKLEFYFTTGEMYVYYLPTKPCTITEPMIGRWPYQIEKLVLVEEDGFARRIQIPLGDKDGNVTITFKDRDPMTQALRDAAYQAMRDAGEI